MTKRKPLIVQRADLSQFNDEVMRSDDPRLTKCRTGCPTRDHKSYADCCKGIQINSGVLLTSSGKSWEGELQAYRDARSQGIQPTGTTMAKVQEALDISDATGVAYQGDNPYG